MARKEARIFTSIWQDPEFRALSWQAQWVFFAILSQPLLSYCGVITYTPKRWSTLAGGLTPRVVRLAVAEAEGGRFVIVDEDAEEMLVRSFAKRDGILKSPNLTTAMGRDFEHIHSDQLRDAFLEGLPEGFGKGFAQDVIDGLPEPIRERSRGRDAEPPSPSPPLPANTSSSTTATDASQPTEPVDDDDGKLHETALGACDVITRRRFDATETAVRNERAYLAKTGQSVADEHYADALALLRAFPDLEPEELADRLEAPPTPRAARWTPPVPPGPVTPPPFVALDNAPFEEAAERGKAALADLRPHPS